MSIIKLRSGVGGRGSMRGLTREKFIIRNIFTDGEFIFAIIDRKTDEVFFRGRITEVGAWLALYDEGFFN